MPWAWSRRSKYHKTMVLGTSGMTVMDQATGYNVFADGGFAGTRHAITQLLTRSGEVFYDFDRDGPKPRRVLSEKAMSEMNSMLVQVPEWGTARRAALPQHPLGRQDRHHAGLPRRLVCRLHRQLHGRRLARQ